MSDGNSFHRLLVVPAQLELLGPEKRELAVELACGNGNFLGHLLEVAERVVAVDGSSEMLAYAASRCRERCSFVCGDLRDIDPQAIASPGSADVVVCTMALMDIAQLEPVARLVATLLAESGAFVCTIGHPSFWGPPPRVEKTIDFPSHEGRVEPVRSLRVRRYLTEESLLGRADASLPQPQLYFARPLHALVSPFMKHGLVIDGLLEPRFPDNENLERAVRLDEWRSYPDIPPVLAMRFKRRTSVLP
jgi:SAM-dependent methyltransferase